jgi:hypothetical protein
MPLRRSRAVLPDSRGRPVPTPMGRRHHVAIRQKLSFDQISRLSE